MRIILIMCLILSYSLNRNGVVFPGAYDTTARRMSVEELNFHHDASGEDMEYSSDKRAPAKRNKPHYNQRPRLRDIEMRLDEINLRRAIKEIYEL